VADDPHVGELAGAAGLYPKELRGERRRWFARRLLAYTRSAHPAADPLTHATTLATTARDRVAACIAALRVKEGMVGIDAVPTLERWTMIAYGALGVHPAVFLADDRPQLLFYVVLRRTRAVELMDDLNGGGAFFYPDNLLKQYPADPLPGETAYWQGISTVGQLSGLYPFVLTTRGAQDPLAALEDLFIRRDTQAECTHVDCASAAMIVLQTAVLAAADDPVTLGAALMANGQRHVAIDHPLGSGRVMAGVLDQGAGPIVRAPTPTGAHVTAEFEFAWAGPRTPYPAVLVDADFEASVVVEQRLRGTFGYTGEITLDQLMRSFGVGSRLVPSGLPEFHAATDPRPLDSLFEQPFVPDEELQIGDHVYAASHPLHRAYISESPWAGEHAVLADVRDAGRVGLTITGHGVPRMKLLQAIDSKLLCDVNALLAVLRIGLERWLSRTQTAQIAAGAFEDLTPETLTSLAAILRERRGLDTTAAVTGTWTVYAVAAGGSFTRDDERKPRIAPPVEILVFTGSVGAASVAAGDILLWRLAANFPPVDWGTSFVPIELLSGLGTGLAPAARYGVYYFDDIHGAVRATSLYYTSGPRRGGARHLGYGDLGVGTLMVNRTGNALVTRPRVGPGGTATTAYVSALRTMGALPASG
jgi:hypothetical protein